MDIGKSDIVDISNTNEENCKQFVYEYGENKYQMEFAEAAKNFPYNNEGLSADLKLKNVLDWYLFEWVNPRTEKTIVKEFVEKFNIPEPLRGKMLQTEKPFYSKFKVLSVNHNQNCLTIVDTKTGKKHDVVNAHSLDDYKVGRELNGRIHQWGDAWGFAGIVSIAPSEEEVEMEMFKKYGVISPRMVMHHFEDSRMEEIEGCIIGAKTTISTILNKYPAHWIDGICDNLKVQRSGLHKKEKIRKILDKILQDTESILADISEEEKKCLKVVADAGGMVKYSKLKEFSGEMPYWWPEHGVNSTIGKLRSKGLLYIGKTMLSGRFYKMALIAREMVPKIQNKVLFLLGNLSFSF